ncbi:MAG TPA: rRNA maturation RNase YbeY [Anaerolineae bacterium]|nr:rRNA maturation RNase YbeY [Anaerolineae bacterium]
MERKSFVEEIPDWDEEEDVPAVDVQVAPDYCDLLSEERLRQIVEKVLDAEGVPSQVALVVTDDEGIRELSRDFLGIDEPTDVLSFSAQEETEGFVAAPEVAEYLGDVIVSYPRAAAQAKEAGHTVDEEMAVLIIHGLLHLLGYDHADDDGRAAMWARQDALLAMNQPE